MERKTRVSTSARPFLKYGRHVMKDCRSRKNALANTFISTFQKLTDKASMTLLHSCCIVHFYSGISSREIPFKITHKHKSVVVCILLHTKGVSLHDILCLKVLEYPCTSEWKNGSHLQVYMWADSHSERAVYMQLQGNSFQTFCPYTLNFPDSQTVQSQTALLYVVVLCGTTMQI